MDNLSNTFVFLIWGLLLFLLWLIFKWFLPSKNISSKEIDAYLSCALILLLICITIYFDIKR